MRRYPPPLHIEEGYAIETDARALIQKFKEMYKLNKRGKK